MSDWRALLLKFLEGAFGWGITYTLLGVLITFIVIIIGTRLVDALAFMSRFFRRKARRSVIERLQEHI